MNTAEKIHQEASRLPEHLAKEVLDFIEYIELKHGLQEPEIQNLKNAQIPVMNNIWDNQENEVWDEH